MKFLKRIIAFINKIIEKYEPITSKCIHDNVFAIAGQSAFFMILSFVPLTMFFVSVLQNLNIPPEVIEIGLQSIFSDSMLVEITDFLTQAYDSAVGISFVTLIITLWSASQGIHAITNGLNRVYKAYENRNWLFLRIRAMLYTIAFFLLFAISLIIIVLGKSLDEWLSPYLMYLPNIVSAIFHLRYAILFVFLTIVFALIYRNFPSISRKEHREYKFKYQLPGAVLCTLSWYVLSFGISIYVGNFNGFSVYGVLTRLAVIMIWLYFCMMCLMICAEINYVYHDTIKAFSFKKQAKKIILSLRSRKNKPQA